MTKGWGIIEDGELWPAAYETREEAMAELARAVCDLASKKPPSDREWNVRIAQVEIQPCEPSARTEG